MPITTDPYCTIQQADAYWTQRGNQQWLDKDDSDKESALVIATDYINVNYTFKDGVFSDGIPDALIRSTAWLAFYSDESLGAPKDRGGMIDKVKAGSVEIEWSEYAPAGKAFDYLDSMLKDLIEVPAANAIKLVRV